MLSKKGFEKALLEAHALLQIKPLYYDDSWDSDRIDWLKKWGKLLLLPKKDGDANGKE